MKKRNRVAYLAMSAMLLAGCANTQSKEEIKDTERNNETDVVLGTESGEDKGIISEHFEVTMENVRFDMEVSGACSAENVTVSKVKVQKADAQAGAEKFLGNTDAYQLEEYEEENESGENTTTITYVDDSYNEYFTAGPCSSMCSYYDNQLSGYILNAFCLDKENERYNAQLFSTSGELDFASRDEAYKMVQDALSALGLKIEGKVKGYALDYQTLQQEEYWTDMDMNVDKSQYKESWTADDDAYYFCVYPECNGLPVYYSYCPPFDVEVNDINAPVSAIVSKDGIESLSVGWVFEVSEVEEQAKMAEIDQIAQTIADKYNQILNSGTYEFQTAELYYYVDIQNWDDGFSMRPVWIVKGVEKNNGEETDIQIVVDAQTAEEISFE